MTEGYLVQSQPVREQVHVEAPGSHGRGQLGHHLDLPPQSSTHQGLHVKCPQQLVSNPQLRGDYLFMEQYLETYWHNVNNMRKLVSKWHLSGSAVWGKNMGLKL